MSQGTHASKSLVAGRVTIVTLCFAVASLVGATSVSAQHTHADHHQHTHSDHHQAQRRGTRARLGIAGVGALIFEGPGAAGGIAGFAGIQFNDTFALYYLATGLVGSASENNGNFRMLGTMWNTLMMDLTFANAFQVGAGPSLDIVFGCESFRRGSGPWCGNSGPYFGLDARLAFAFGGRGWSRSGFFIALDGHPTFLPNVVLMTTTVSFGVQTF